MHSAKASLVTTKRRGSEAARNGSRAITPLGERRQRARAGGEPGRRTRGAGRRRPVYKVGSEGAVRAAVTPQLQPQHSLRGSRARGAALRAGTRLSSARRPRGSRGSRRRACAERRRRACASLRRRARGPGGGRAGTHRLAGRAGRSGPGARVSAAAECDAPCRAQGPSSGLGRVAERRAGQETGSRAASERPHAPGDLRRSARPPARGRRGDP